LRGHGLHRTHHWPRGVDLDQFNPSVKPYEAMAGLPRPIMLNVGRLAVEKNIGAFLDLDVPGSKVVVGGGPALEKMKRRYPKASFLGPKEGMELASTYAAADVFVFPSRTDTFGLVNIEALACGLPVAAYPVPGPLDILGPHGRGIHGGKWPIGALDEDLAIAVERALHADRNAAIREARHYSWEACTRRFLDGLAVDRAAEGSRLAA
jgi:glycosyltransferase involved in cell wall biosynthesis